MKDVHKATMSDRVGPGGWGCACCGPINAYGGKRKLHRRSRRKLKQNLHLEFE